MIDCQKCGFPVDGDECRNCDKPSVSGLSEKAQQVAEIRARAQSYVPPIQEKVPFEKHGDGRDWAREIQAMHAAGRYDLTYGIECAKEALANTATGPVTPPPQVKTMKRELEDEMIRKMLRKTWGSDGLRPEKNSVAPTREPGEEG